MVSKKMNTKILTAFLAVFLLCFSGFVSAGDLVSGSIATEFNSVALGFGVTMAGTTEDVVPVRVTFVAIEDASDVRVKVWMEGHRSDVTDSTGRFNLVDGSTYTKLLSLELPEELKDTTKEFTLHVAVSNSDGYDSAEYTILMQRESYDFDVLSVDFSSRVSAGDIVPVSVVVENTGMEELEDGYVTVSVNELGVSARGYFGDLVSVEVCDECNNDDSVQKTVYLKMPRDSKEGVYEMTVKVYNKDSIKTVRELIRVDGSASTLVLPTVKSQDIVAGETVTYDLLVVNSGDDIGVYKISAISGGALSVSVPSVITVGPDSSEIVTVSVTALSGAAVGSYAFSIDVEGQQTVLGANVTSGGVSTSVVALTVVLVIVFLVLLVVLIVLLARREKPVEEAETSYY